MAKTKAKTGRPLPAAISAALDALPTSMTLEVDRENEEKQTREFDTTRDPGCWVAMAPCNGYGGAWGRSEESAEDAVRKCLLAGGKPLKTRGKIRLGIYWQPREAWLRHAEKYPDVAPEVGPPGASQNGGTIWWGSPRLTALMEPKA